MGYEIVYKYKDSTDTPGVYSDEVKERSAKIGRVTDEVALEAVAAKVMTQLARRNIFIVDVEIYEYAKKRVTYRETPAGIVIKNRRFSFDARGVVETGEFEEEASCDEGFKPLPSPSKEMAERSCPLLKQAETRKRPIKYEIFDPEPLSLHKAQQKGLKLTVGKRYSVFCEESIGSSVVYTTTDDKGREIKVGSEYFVAMGPGLNQQDDGPTYVGAENQKKEINLWKNYESSDMPEIRRR